ncbi:MAG: dTMP kinase [Candidatus Thorarchaeota archaeon]
MAQGLFIALEGIDGSGTTTHTKLLANWLRRKGLTVVQTHEPTEHRIGRLIRRLLQDPSVPPAIDALLFAADRIDNTVNRIHPALKKGKIVITDRYVESSIAYQSSSGLELEWIQKLNRFALTPSLTILLDITPYRALKRKKRPKPKEKFEQTDFLKKVRQIFLKRANDLGFKVVNAEKTIQEVQTIIRQHVEVLLTSLK